MNKIIQKLIVGTLLLAATMVYGNTNGGNGGVPGAYATLVGNSLSLSVSTPDELTTAYLNPAGQFMVDRNNVTLLYSALLKGSVFNYVSYAYPVRLVGTFALSRTSISMGDLNRRSEIGKDIGEFETGESLYLITYAHKLLPWMILGTNFKITNISLDEHNTYNIGVDVGLLAMPLKNVYAGIMLQNIVRPKMKLMEDTDVWPANLFMGIVYNGILQERLSLAFDAMVLDLGTEDEMFTQENMMNWNFNFHYGLKYAFMENISLKIGFDRREYDAGFSLFYGGMQFDYMLGHGDSQLGANHRISIVYQFGLDRATKEEDRLRRMADRDRLQRPRKLYQEAMTFYDQEKLWNAAFHFGEIPALYPEYEHADAAMIYSAEALQQIGMNKAALGIYRDFLKKFPMSTFRARALYKLMKGYFDNREYERALVVYGRLSKQFAGTGFYAPATYLAGQSLYQRKMYKKSLDMLQGVPAREESYCAAQYTMALCELQRGNVAQIVAHFRNVLDVPPEKVVTQGQKTAVAWATVNLAHVYYQMGRFDDALKYYAKVLPDAEGYKEALIGSAWASIKKNDLTSAISTLQKIRTTWPNSDDAIEAMQSLGHCYAKLDQNQDAVEMYRGVINACSQKDILALKQQNVVEQLQRAQLKLEEAQKRLASSETMIALNAIKAPKLRRNRRNMMAQYTRYKDEVKDEQDVITALRFDMKRQAHLQDVLQEAQYALPMMIQKRQVNAQRDDILNGYSTVLIALRKDKEHHLDVLRTGILNTLDAQRGKGAYTESSVDSLFTTQRGAIDTRFDVKIDSIIDVRDEAIIRFTAEERKGRLEAIEQYRRYLMQYEDVSSAEVMLQLAQLYYDQGKDEYMDAMDEYDNLLEKFYEGTLAELPPEPKPDFSKAVGLYKDLITTYPTSPSVDRALYALGYCYVEQGLRGDAHDVYLDLVRKFPGSMYYPEANLRLGEYYFMNNDYETAISYYKKVLPYRENKHFEKALYKLGWAYYKLNDYENSINTFITLMDFSEEQEEESDLRSEAMDYISIGFNEFGGLQNFQNYFHKIGGRAYEKDLLYRLGDTYKTIDKLYDAVNTYKALLARAPEYPKAPEVQNAIIGCHKRNRFDEEMIAAREDFISAYGPDGAWHKANADNDKMIRMAEKLMEENIHAAATYYHMEFRRRKDPTILNDAVRHYRAYITTFPKSSKTYKTHYLMADALYERGSLQEAADEYHKIAFMYKDKTAFREDAAYNVILCYEFMKKELGRDGVAGGDSIALVNEKIIGAAHNFMELLPKSEKVPELLFIEGRIRFGDEKYAEAREVYIKVIEKFPNNALAAQAYELIALSYTKEKRYEESEKWYRKMQTSGNIPKGRDGDIGKLVSASVYERAGQLRAEEKYMESATEYERLVKEFGDAPYAAEALAAAGFCYEKMENWGYGIRVYEKLASEYPESKWAEQALFLASSCHEKLENWELAAENYWQLSEMFPQSAHAAAALYNAGLNYEKIGDFEKAGKCYKRLGERYPENEYAPDAFLGIAIAYEKNEMWEKAAETFGQFTRIFTQDRALYVEAMCREGLALMKAGKDEDALRVLEEAVLNAKRYDATTEFYPAKAQFQLGEIVFKEFEEITFTLPADKMKRDLVRKGSLLKEVIKYYTDAIRSGVAEWATAATYRLGATLENYADCMFKQDRIEMSEEQKFAFEISIRMNQVPQFLYKAANYYRTNIEQARNADITNEWVTLSENKLLEVTHRLGLLYEEIAELFRNAPLPAGLTGAEQDEYKYALEDKAFGFEDNAVQVYESNLKNNRMFSIQNEWLKKSLTRLVAIAPDRFTGREIAFDDGAIEVDSSAVRTSVAQRDSMRLMAKERSKGVSDTLLNNLVQSRSDSQAISLDDLLADVDAKEKPIIERIEDWHKIEQMYNAKATVHEPVINAMRDSLLKVSKLIVGVQHEFEKLNQLDSVMTVVRTTRKDVMSSGPATVAEAKIVLKKLDAVLYDLSVPPLTRMSGIMKLIKYTRRRIKNDLKK